MTELPIYDLVVNNGLLAQIQDPDILGQMSDAWKNFVESGQIWALLIGVFFGYIFASFTRF
ncbi:hypothetical protein H6G11_05980 [Cyanobacterium aponinum FACHB-4101]|uniref:hypothetical protein n=1 Tax=Cyanobacterium aponinum TaxID=379064 RepID=UPI0016811B94|nr:hypothetical protein [Cyanobacterium aponinum]MBD2393801.1 hypothetical protein [Cyanobacterium aponinum FACHB-4101]